MASPANGFVLVSTAAFAVFLFGLYGHLTHFEENGCNMTYLFEYPQFVRISLDDEVAMRHRRYGLYAFAEGSRIEKVRAMKFDGIPVLFVPGSRGSHKQVRSLASVSLRKWLGSRTPFHFDYFALDLDNDHSGLYGGVLKAQTDFLKFCVKRVLSLYRGPVAAKPTSVVLVGHSMGGLVAEGLFLEPDFDSDQVRLIVTLATPHTPALLPDQRMSAYYSRLAHFWSTHRVSMKNLTLVSIGGGARDIIVKSSQTVSKFADINVISPSVSDVWLSVDHYCILWCKELVIVLVRSLFDSVDLTTRQITRDAQLRRDVFRYHLLDRSAGKKYQTSVHPKEMALWSSESGGGWTSLEKNQAVWDRPRGIATTSHITVPLATAADTMVVEGINHKTKDWLFTCRADGSVNGTRICKYGKNLSSKGRIFPSYNMKRKVVILDLSKLRMDSNTHVVVRTFPTNEPVRLSFDLFRKRDRSLMGAAYYVKPTTLLTQTARAGGAALYHSVDMVAMHRIWHTYQLVVESDDCFVPNLAHVTLKVPWNNEGTTRIISGQKGTVPLTIFTPKPNGKDVKDPKVEMILNPECSYTIKLEKTLYHGLSSLVGNSAVGILSSVAVCLLMTLSAQITSLKEDLNCPLLHFIIPTAARPYYILPAFSITSAIARYLHSMFPVLPSCDAQQNNGLMDALFIPLLLHCSGLALTYFLALALLLTVIFQGQAFVGIILRFLNKFFFGLTWVSEYIASAMNKVPFFVAVFMIIITFTACSGLAMCIGLVFYFFKLVSLYEDFWQEIVYWPLRALKAFLFRKRQAAPSGRSGGAKRKGSRNATLNPEESFWPKFEIPSIDDISFHLTMIMLWALPTLVSIPSVLFWGRNYRYSVKLENDPFFINGIIMSACGGLLWQGDLPRPNLPLSRQVSRLVFASSVLVLVYGQTSIYRMSWIVVGVICVVTAHQTFGHLLASDHRDSPDEDVGILQHIRKVLLATSDSATNLDGKDFTPNDSEGDKSYSCSEDGSEESSSGGESSGNDSDGEEDDSSAERDTKDMTGKRTNKEKTPSDDGSSSFENISVKDMKE